MLKSSFSKGTIDNLSKIVKKILIMEIANPLSVVFHLSLSTRIFPDRLKIKKIALFVNQTISY